MRIAVTSSGNSSAAIATGSKPGNCEPRAQNPRIGEISFINCLPITLPIENELIPVDAEITLGTPAVLNQSFENGKLEASAMSSFYYLSKRNKLELFPEISIACEGPVGSVLFFSKRELKDLHPTKIAVTAQSATSVNLLRVLLGEFCSGDEPFQILAKPDLSNSDIDAALIIGDDALAIDEDWSKCYIRKDLGQWWFERYNLPMVFGVWAASRAWADSYPEDFFNACKSHLLARDVGLESSFPDVLNEATRRSGLSKDRMGRYLLSELSFELSSEHLQGLALFQKLCEREGLLRS